MSEAGASSQKASTPFLRVRNTGYLAAQGNVKAVSESEQQQAVTIPVQEKASSSPAGIQKASKQKPSVKPGTTKFTKSGSKQPEQPTASENAAGNSQAAWADGLCSKPKDTVHVSAEEADQSQRIDVSAPQCPANAKGTVSLSCAQTKGDAPVMQLEASSSQASLQHKGPANYTQAASSQSQVALGRGF